MTEAKKAPKAENYTSEQTAAMVARYLAAPSSETVAAIATEMGKTVRSVIAKLTREKKADGTQVYIAKTYKTKAGDEPEKKDTIADAIGKVLKLSDGEVDSLTKANKTALTKIFAALANSVPVEPESEQERKDKAAAVQMLAENLSLDATEAGSLMRANASVLSKLAQSL